MVNEARAYRERVLADLDRRTTLARQQIEELIHGRDRLLQVFERARLVAVDVTSELRAVDSPDELVNLSPTTGPVPLMVPNQRRPEPDDVQADSETTDEATPDEATTDEATTDDGTDAIDVADEPDAGDDGGEPDDAAASAVDAPTDDTDDTDETDVDLVAEAEDTVGDDTDDTDDTDDADDPDEATDELATDGAPVDDTAAPAPAKDDTNVVSLFRGRPSPADAAIADEHPSTDDGARPDVGGIFERLRQEAPADEVADTTDAAPTDDGGGHETQAVETETETETIDTDEVDEVVPEPTPFSRRDEAIVPLIVSGARRLKRVLADEQNEALDTLRQNDPVIALDALVPSLDDHVAQYLGAIGDELVGAAAAGAVEAGARDNKTMRRKLTRAGALTAAHDQLRLALVTPLRDRLGRAVTDGDGDNDDITKKVRAVYREWKTQHIDDQLDDIFRRAFSGGLSTTIEPGAHLTWTVDPGASACPDCEDNSLAGGVPSGEPFPTGHLMAPAHPGCRCLALPAD